MLSSPRKCSCFGRSLHFLTKRNRHQYLFRHDFRIKAIGERECALNGGRLFTACSTDGLAFFEFDGFLHCQVGDVFDVCFATRMTVTNAEDEKHLYVIRAEITEVIKTTSDQTLIKGEVQSLTFSLRLKNKEARGFVTGSSIYITLRR